MTYGTALQPTELQRMHQQPRSVIGEIDTSPAGNLILAVGRTISEDGGWEKTEHVVMTKEEAIRFAGDVLATVGAYPHDSPAKEQTT